jgi:mono/diheme cytochrome c family protein
MGRPFAAVLAAGLLLAAPGLPAAPGQTAVDFQRDVRPILAGRCFKCHGPASHKAGLRLDVRASATKRKAIVPGRPEASKLIHRVRAADDEERMPPPAGGDRLKPAQVEVLRKWIAGGAEYSPHWAFVAPRRPPLPPVMDGAWVRNPIDYFILARLDKEGLRPSSEADRPTLIRRLSLDLLGLLPSPREVEDFVHDGRPDAYERLVDRLLASPHYGERQARHWLDLARYADSNGYTIDGKRSIWPWRDWAIAAFNRDLPFDRFTVEQLAGDLLPGAAPADLIATGFHRNTSFNEEGGTNPEQFRVERTVDRTNTTGAVWLGLTVGCAQCHDHKYDPISQKEYYQLYAFFNSTDEPRLPLPTPEQAAKLRALNAELARAKKVPPPRPKSPAELEKLVAELEKETNGGWRVIYPKAVMSEQGAVFTALEDRSVLAGGKVGPSDTYTVQAVAPETGTVTAVRLEALTHPSLPMKGPGRYPNGNFVLSRFTFETDGVPHPFRKAVADHSQSGYEVREVLKGDLHRGWAVNAGDPKQRNVDRQAVFYLKEPYEVREGQAFVFTLRFSEVPSGYALGRFRLAVTFASPRFLELPLAAQNIVLTERRSRGPADMARLRQVLAASSALSERVAELRKQIQALDAQVDSTLILRARPRPTHVLKRGDFLAPGDAVEPGTPAVLPPLDGAGRPVNRLDLARWLVSPENPLTARVVVNRMWQHYFGKGLVETENDFGTQGALPTHAELLDWLATEFVRRGWGAKAMHRLIVTSATYRQASRARPDLREKDPGNRLLGRQHRLRLEAETIRDAALSASGLLARKVGGPGVYPPQPPEIFAFTQSNHPWPESKGPDRYRRGMYTFIWRQSQHPLLTTFDGPDAQAACTRRNRSNTPLQALHLANDPTFVEIARALAERVSREGPADDAGRVEYAFRLCFSRAPNSGERGRVLQYLGQQRQADPGQAWTMVARVLLNLDEFITRE